jgi:hypothetical protein
MTDDAHRGTLRESAFGFAVWTVCSCGWRSQAYGKSSSAWTAHEYHRMAVAADD